MVLCVVRLRSSTSSLLLLLLLLLVVLVVTDDSSTAGKDLFFLEMLAVLMTNAGERIHHHGDISQRKHEIQ